MALTATPFEPPSWVTTALIEGRWFAFGAEAADQTDLVVAPWNPSGLLLDPITPTEHIEDGVRYWVAEIPAEISDIAVGNDSSKGNTLSTSMRRPDR